MRRFIIIACLALAAHPFVLPQEQDRPEEGARPITTRVVPVYPELARKLSLNGIVKLRVTVAPDGVAKGTEVLGGNPLLAKAAQDAISRWRWVAAPRESIELVELRFHPH
jgi:TonB family protein